MDQNQTNTPAQATQNVITDDQQKELFADLGLENVPEDKKQQLMDNIIQMLMQRIFVRVSSVMTEKDEQTIEDLKLRDDSDLAINEFIIGRVPNLDAIAGEEVKKLREELKQSATLLSSAMQQPAKEA